MKKNFAFEKMNYILLIAGVVVIILGFILMTGAPTTEQAYNPDIFSTRRIFISIIVAILWRTPSKSADKEEDTVPFYKRER